MLLIGLIPDVYKRQDPDQRKTFGQTSNKVKQELSKAVEDKKEVLEHHAIIDKIKSETIDLSLPSYKLDQDVYKRQSRIL